MNDSRIIIRCWILQHLTVFFPLVFSTYHICCSVHFSDPSFTLINASWWDFRWKTVQSAQLKWFLLVILDRGDRCRWVDRKSRFLSAKPDDLNVISALPDCLIGPAVSGVKCCFVLSWNRKKLRERGFLTLNGKCSNSLTLE